MIWIMNFFRISFHYQFSVSPDAPLKPLVPEMEMSSMECMTGINRGEMSRVDDSVHQEPVIKIKSLLPLDHMFQNFSITSSRIMKLLSSNQAEHVMDMLAKASYVR